MRPQRLLIGLLLAACPSTPRNWVRAVLETEYAGRLEYLVVVDAEDAAIQGRPLGDKPARLREEIPGPRVAYGPGRLEAVKIRRAHPASDSIQFRITPGDREGDRSIQERAEVVSCGSPRRSSMARSDCVASKRCLEVAIHTSSRSA